MLGLMQNDELTVDEFLAYAERWHGRTQVVSRCIDGAIERIDYATVAAHARRVSAALLAWGMLSQPGWRRRHKGRIARPRAHG